MESAVILLEFLPLGAGERDAAERTLAVAKRAFARKRKQIGGVIPPDTLAALGISPAARPQELGIDSWRSIASALP